MVEETIKIYNRTNLTGPQTSFHIAHKFNTHCGQSFHPLYTALTSRIFQREV